MTKPKTNIHLDGIKVHGHFYVEANSLLAALYKMGLPKFAEGIEEFRRLWEEQYG